MAFMSDELNGLAVHNLRHERREFRPVTFTTIDEMVEANNDSRVHLGVHWDFDPTLGAVGGRKVAQRVWDHHQTP